MKVQQKIVIKVKVRCDKCRSKAMEMAAAADAALEGEKKDKIVVTGVRVDSANLAIRSYKKLGHASLEGVEQLEQEKTEVKKENQDIIRSSKSNYICMKLSTKSM